MTEPSTDPIPKKKSALDQIPLLVAPDSLTDQVKITTLSDETPVRYLEGILTPEDCNHLIHLGRPKLANSTMVVKNKEIVDQNRSSRTGPITYHGDPKPKDPVIQKLIKKLTNWTGLPATHIEAIKVVHYQVGQKYVPHHDYFTQTHPQFLKPAGDRCLTFFIYLNTVDQTFGGATHFPKLKLSVQPKIGDGVFWLNMNSQGDYLKLTQHGGAEILPDPTGHSHPEKWGLNVWFREKPFR